MDLREIEGKLTPQEWSDFMVRFWDHPEFCRHSLRIRNLIGSTVPMELSPGQLKLHKAIHRQKLAGKPVRLVVLKTRRSFFTAGVCAEMFHDVAFNPGRKGLIIADQYEPAGLEAFDYLVQFQTNYVPFGPPGATLRLPPLDKDTQQQLEWGNQAGISVLSAQGGDVGRGGGVHFLLGDEVAFWRAAGKTLTAVLNMVPKRPNTTVILQSTANGYGGEFYELCMKAQDPRNDSGWEFLFFGWLEHPEYRAKVDDPAKLQASLNRDERALQEIHHATLEQIAWRRNQIATECRGKVELFDQEYPLTPDVAWLSHGRPALDQLGLSRMKASDPSVGELKRIEQGPITRLAFMRNEHGHGPLAVWRTPQAGTNYIIGADPSQGKDASSDKRGTDPDYSVAFVADYSLDQVAMLRERIRPAAFAEYLAELAKWYNFAYIVPESNDAGFIDALMRTGYPLELIYRQENDPKKMRERIAGPADLGFQTNPLTRNWLITALDDNIRRNTLNLRSSVAIMECRSMVIKPNGKAEARDGAHDDIPMAAALTCLGIRTAPKTLYQPEAEYGAQAVSVGSR